MLRTISGTLAGIVAGVALVFLLETISTMIYPTPPGLASGDPEQLARLVHQMPLGAKIAVLVAWAAASFGGATVAGWITRRRWPALVVAAFLLAGGMWTMIEIPHPLWMMVAGIIALIVPAIGAAVVVVPRRTV